MKILVIGSGGREHALAWKLRESQHTREVYCAPGNAGIAQEAECLPVDLGRPQEILALAQRLSADLTVIGLGGSAFLPREDPVTAAVYGGTADRVLLTMVDGQIRYRRDGKPADTESACLVRAKMIEP